MTGSNYHLAEIQAVATQIALEAAAVGQPAIANGATLIRWLAYDLAHPGDGRAMDAIERLRRTSRDG